MIRSPLKLSFTYNLNILKRPIQILNNYSLYNFVCDVNILIITMLNCGPNFATPPVVPNATLLTLFMYIRHGSRVPYQHWETPNDNFTWNCGNHYLNKKYRKPIANGVMYDFKYDPNEEYSFKPSCKDGYLLDDGYMQLHNLGNLYRKYMIEETGVLPKDYEEKNIYFRSSFLPRCIESGTSFIDGLYPPEGDNETIAVKIGSESNEPLFPHARYNDEFLKGAIRFSSSEESLRREKEFDKNAAPLVKYYNLTFNHILEKFLVGDYFNVLKCSNQPYPKEIVDDIFDELINDTSYFVTDFFGYIRPIADKPIFNELFNEIDAFYRGEKQNRFTLFSGHDVSIAAVLVGLGYPKGKETPPPYASHLTAELWRKDSIDYIRFTLSGDVVKFRGNELTPYNEFKAIYDEYSSNNHKNEEL